MLLIKRTIFVFLLFACNCLFAQSQENLEYLAKEINTSEEAIDTLSFEQKYIEVGGFIYDCNCEAVIGKNKNYTYILSEISMGFDRFLVILNKLENKEQKYKNKQ